MEANTGTEFEPTIADGSVLLGVGARKKSILGLASFYVYAFGLYGDASSIKSTLGGKYSGKPRAELAKSEAMFQDVAKSDVGLTAKIVIAFGKLAIGNIRSALEEGIAKNMKKINGKEDKEVLAKFTALFTDNLKVPKGTVMELSRTSGNTMRVRLDGQLLGSVQSALLCQAYFEQYIGDDAHDKVGKAAVGEGLAKVFTS